MNRRATYTPAPFWMRIRARVSADFKSFVWQVRH
jgi:hypothetical protein